MFAQLFLQLLTTKVRLDELDFNPQFFLLLLLLHALASLNKSCLVAREFCCLVSLSGRLSHVLDKYRLQL